MKKIRAAVVGYGNIGKFTVEALEAAEDFEIAGIVRRHGAENKPAELAQYDVVKDITELKQEAARSMLQKSFRWALTRLTATTSTRV